MDAKFLVCADSVAVDQRRNTLSIFHILEDFASPSFPFVVPRIAVVAHVVKEPEEPDEPEGVEVHIYLSDEQIFSGPMAMRFQGRLRLRAIADFQGLVVKAPGTLRVTLTKDQRELATWSIVVTDIGRPVVQSELPLADTPPPKS